VSLAPGTRLGIYEVVASIGQGGMGEVFRARDLHLGRDVAIKVLPDSFARDDDRMARFRREAQSLAALNDPHIAQVYQFQESGETAALVMEFVDGRTLAELITSVNSGRGLPVDEALALAAQIAAGLEVAHERGIVHRDLKPANVKVTSAGRVKLLDFGLAKAVGIDAGSSDQMNSPTLTARATEAGMLLGTAAYMSPEQARGRHVDKRTDIWAFGAVLFEMLTGRRLFEGETVSDTVAAVLRHDPDWTLLPADTPPHARALLARCLERDPSRRLRDIGEARLALETSGTPISAMSGLRELPPASPSTVVLSSPAPDSLPSATRRWQVATAVMAVAAVLFAAVAWRLYLQPAAVTDASMELAITAPDDARFHIGSNSGNVLLSPDGRRIAFVAAKGGPRMLWVRSLAVDDARPISGTENASNPFWSPDGRRIGFFASSRLQTVDIAGGLPEVLANVATGGRGGTWGVDGSIIFADAANAPLSRVLATGGAVTPVTNVEPMRGETAHYWPMWLPDGQRILYYVRSSTQPESNGIYVASVDGSAPPVRLVASLSSGTLTAHPITGELYLLWVRDGDLLAQRFDPDAVRLVGDITVITRDVRVEESQRLAYVSASANGVLAWATGRAATSVFALYGRDGRRQRVLDVRPGPRFNNPLLSPDGRHLLFQQVEKGASDVHVHDLQTGSTRPLTIAPEYDEFGRWTADGRSVTHLGYRREGYTIFRVALDSATQPAVLYRSTAILGPGLQTPDGRFLVFSVPAAGGRNIMALRLDGSSAPMTLAEGADIGALSNDGRWVVMAVIRSGRVTTGIARLYSDGASPRLGTLVPIDGAFGIRHDGREVYAATASLDIQAYPIVPSEHSAQAGTPQTLLSAPDALGVTVSGDGNLIVVLEQPYAAGQTLRVLTQWHQRLTQ
jgi:serine/threonine protein kinase/Tol biopolymer transport system component